MEGDGTVGGISPHTARITGCREPNTHEGSLGYRPAPMGSQGARSWANSGLPVPQAFPACPSKGSEHPSLWSSIPAAWPLPPSQRSQHTQLRVDLEVDGRLNLKVDRLLNVQPAKSQGPTPSLNCPCAPLLSRRDQQVVQQLLGMLTPRRPCSRSSGSP